MSETPIIECKPSKWFKTRAVLVLLILSFFALWFFKDGRWGYRDKNVEYVNHSLFKKVSNPEDKFAKTAYQYFNEGEYTKESWSEFASKQVVPTPAKDRELLPEDYNYDAKWPKELVGGYDVIKAGNPIQLWTRVSAREKWSQKPSEKIYDESKISEQYTVCSVYVGLIFIVAFISITIMSRNMMVTETSYIAPGGKEVPYASMHKIDKRKWNNKGIAVIYYKEGGDTKKVKVDGMIYGQFKEEDGVPAEALFAHIMDNFKGELVYNADDDEGEVGDADSEDEKSINVTSSQNS